MAPITFTETELEQPLHTTDYIQYKLHHPAKDTSEITCNEKPKEISTYDQMLSQNDPKFLAPIRKLEKSMGFLTPIRWANTISITALHILAVIWFINYVFLSNKPIKWQTLIFGK